MIDRLLRDRGLLTAAGKGAGVGGLVAYLVFYWAHTVLPETAANLLESILELPFGWLFMLVPGYEQHGVATPGACVLWALAGLIVAVRHCLRKRSPAAERRRLSRSAIVGIWLAVFVVNFVMMGFLGMFMGNSGLSVAQISRTTGIWFPRSATVVGSNENTFREYYMEAAISMSDRDYDWFYTELSEHNTLEPTEGHTSSFDRWSQYQAEDPISFCITRKTSEDRREEVDLLIDRRASEHRVLIYIDCYDFPN